MSPVLIALVIAAIPQADVSGQVLLENGRPAANAFLVLQSFHQGADRIWSNRVDCDAEGRFTFPADSPLSRLIHVYSKDLKESVISIPSKPEDWATIRLKPSCEITMRFKVLGEPADGTVHFSSMPGLNLPWVTDMDKNGEVRGWMPQGDYAVSIRSDESDFDQQMITLKGGPQVIDAVGTANPFRKLRGQPAPELQILDTSGVAKTATLKDYRGRYVLLEFWGYWCKPCVESSLPGLIKLKKDNPDLDRKLAILAVHENAGGERTLAAIREHMPAFERDYWGGPLPFPIILEKPASLTKTYGIRAYPTAVLIDPDGKVIDRADPNLIRSVLGLR